MAPWTVNVCLSLVAAVALQLGPCFCMGGARNVNRLLKTLFTDQEYNPVVRPALDYSRPTKVTVEMALNILLGLDIKNQVMHIHGFMKMSWYDELLNWNASEYGDLESIILPQGKVWRPDIVFYNSVGTTDRVEEELYLGSDETLVTISSDGYVRWEPVFVLHSSCQVNIEKYPYDENVCPILVHSWMSDNTTVLMEFADNPVNMRFMFPNEEYEISSAGTFTKDLPFMYNKQLFYQQLGFLVRLARRPICYWLSLLIPVFLLAIMSTLSFMLPPDNPDKINLSITVLLAFTVFLGVIDSSLPDNSDKLSLLVIYTSIMLVQSFLGVVGNALVLLLHHSEERQLESSAALKCDENVSITERFRKNNGNPQMPSESQCHVEGQDVAMTTRMSTDAIMEVTFRNNRLMTSTCMSCGYMKQCFESKALALNRIFFIGNGLFVVGSTAFVWVKMMT